VSDGKELASLSVEKGGLFACDFSPDGKTVVAGGFDGLVRVVNVEDGKLIKQFSPVPIELAKK
jgi:WD40 repeat protein